MPVWGYNETDQLAYGLVGTRMWAVDGAGTFYDLGTVGGLGSYSGSNAGDVLPDGTMLFKAGGGGSVLGRIDLTRTPYSLESTVTLTGPASGANYIDVAFNPADGNVYSIDSSADRLFYFNPDTGATSYLVPRRIPAVLEPSGSTRMATSSPMTTIRTKSTSSMSAQMVREAERRPIWRPAVQMRAVGTTDSAAAGPSPLGSA